MKKWILPFPYTLIIFIVSFINGFLSDIHKLDYSISEQFNNVTSSASMIIIYVLSVLLIVIVNFIKRIMLTSTIDAICFPSTLFLLGLFLGGFCSSWIYTSSPHIFDILMIFGIFLGIFLGNFLKGKQCIN